MLFPYTFYLCPYPLICFMCMWETTLNVKIKCCLKIHEVAIIIIWLCNLYIHTLISAGGFAFFLVFITVFFSHSYLGFTSSSKYLRSFKYFCFTFEKVLPFSLHFGNSLTLSFGVQTGLKVSRFCSGWCAFKRI